MFLKWILYVLLVIVVLRLVRRALRGSDARRASRKGLDPERAVRASWSEVSDDEGKGSGERQEGAETRPPPGP